MTNELIYPHTQQKCRMVGTPERPEWVVADVCAVLGLTNPSEALVGVPENETGISSADTSVGPRSVLTVTEPGLYRLIFKSRKPEAERFKTWIVNDVLPQIRKTGYFGPLALVTSEDVGQGLLQLTDAVKTMTEAVTGLAQSHADVRGEVKTLSERVTRVETFLTARRKRVPDAVRERHQRAVFASPYYGRCPCCRDRIIVDPTNGQLILGSAEFDHWYQPNQNGITTTWLICAQCHADLTHQRISRTSRMDRFTAYQDNREDIEDRTAKQNRLPFVFGAHR